MIREFDNDDAGFWCRPGPGQGVPDFGACIDRTDVVGRSVVLEVIRARKQA